MTDLILDELIKIYSQDTRPCIPKAEVMELLTKLSVMTNLSNVLEGFGMNVRGLVSVAQNQPSIISLDTKGENK